MKTLHLDKASAQIGSVKKYRVTYGGDVYQTSNGKYIGFIDDPEEVEKVRRYREKKLIEYIEKNFIKTQ